MVDIRGYINPFVPGGQSEAAQRRAMPDAEIYVENKSGKVIDQFIKSLRPGSIVEVSEVHYLAPGHGQARTRRRVLTERIEAIRAAKSFIHEKLNGRQSKGHMSLMLLGAYEQIASSGRARKHDRKGRPETWPKDGQVYEGYRVIWHSRRYVNDYQRRAAMIKRFAKAPSLSWLRIQFGSPHKVGE